jgi:polar amino acid transport system substrate-binding protein
MIAKTLKAGLAAAAMLAVTSSAVMADTLADIISRGKMVVGSKADYAPWGMRDAQGNIVGMEVDMAMDLAKRIGEKAGKTIEVEIVPVVASNRMQFLEQGKIDIMIATMSDRPDRRKIVGIVGPNYYTSGTNIMAPKALGLKSWEDLRDKPVCGKQGAFYNKIVTERYGAKITAFQGNSEAKQALRDKKCIAWVYDDSSIGSDLASGEWDEFEMPLQSEDDNPWALAVPKAEENCVFGQFMSGMQYNWLSSGKLIELEKKWGIKPTKFLADKKEQHERLARSQVRLIAPIC